MFCPKCGSIMIPVRENGQKILRCRRCGYKVDPSKKPEFMKLFRSTSEIEHGPKHEFIIIEKEITTLPKTKVICPKCGNNEAYFRLEQTRSADEPSTRIFTCTNCGYTWREYD